MQCYACDRSAIAQCQRCGRYHCAEHGGALCSSCTDPVASAPTSATFRIALAGLLGASVLALWLLLRPPSVPGEGSGIIQQPDSTPNFTPALTPDTGEETLAPTDVATSPTDAPSVTSTPEPTEAPTEASTDAPAEPAQIEYIVQIGDSWNSIADAYGVDAATLASFNGYSIEDVLPADATLIIPQ
ncbi:MAG TPA: LysM peptidoglycan-binding domain-containing protein [Dehalococcoidia bacterium]|nr:LysM peptidoglycan-binding domain-containing protein [Dehalococcoidia bacterium]